MAVYSRSLPSEKQLITGWELNRLTLARQPKSDCSKHRPRSQEQEISICWKVMSEDFTARPRLLALPITGTAAVTQNKEFVDLKFTDLFQRWSVLKNEGVIKQDDGGKWASVASCKGLVDWFAVCEEAGTAFASVNHREPFQTSRGNLSQELGGQASASIPPASVPQVYADSSVVLRSRGFVVSSGFKRQSDAVDAESLARWLRPIVKHVTQVGVALVGKRRTDGMSVEKQSYTLASSQLNATDIFTKNLGPCAAQTVVRATDDGGVAFILPPCPMSLFKRRPAGPRVVLGFWTVEWSWNLFSRGLPHF